MSHSAKESQGSGYLEGLLNDVKNGVLEPLPFKLGNVPPDLSGLALRVVEDIEMLAGLRLAVLDPRPMPYALDKAAERIGCGSSTVHRIVQGLRDSGALQMVGKEKVPGQPRPMYLYEPARAADVTPLRRVA